MIVKPHRRRAVCMALLSPLLAIAAPAWAQATDPFLGEIAIFGFGFCPRGWSPTNGALILISQNTALFSLLGTTYGGDGQTTFALPTTKPMFTATGAVLTQCIAVQGVFPSRN